MKEDQEALQERGKEMAGVKLSASLAWRDTSREGTSTLHQGITRLICTTPSLVAALKQINAFGEVSNSLSSPCKPRVVVGLHIELPISSSRPRWHCTIIRTVEEECIECQSERAECENEVNLAAEHTKKQCGQSPHVGLG